MVYDILLVDDESIWRELFVDLVEGHLQLPGGDSVRLTCADTVQEAREQIQRGGWAMIFCDLLWNNDPNPTDAGIELINCASELRKSADDNQLSKHTAIYALTQYSKDQRMSSAAIIAGADEVIGKSTPHERIAQRMQEALGQLRRTFDNSPGGLVIPFWELARPYLICSSMAFRQWFFCRPITAT